MPLPRSCRQAPYRGHRRSGPGHKRGVYGGAIGYIDFTGNMDCCIGIRLAYKKGNHVYACSGAGIVADSIPEQEHQECLNKAKAVVIALRQANGGIDK